MSRITKDPTERRQEILDTALKLFWEKGYEKTSMTEIAQAMQVAQGLCYRYFPSKEALFQTAVDQYAQRQVDQIASVLRKPLPSSAMGRRAKSSMGRSPWRYVPNFSRWCNSCWRRPMSGERSRLQTRRRPPLFVSMDSWAFYGIKRSVERREYAASRHF